MPVKAMCVAPHGGIAIGGESAKATREGFAAISKAFDNSNIDYIFVVDPHEAINPQKFLMFLALNYAGELDGVGEKIYSGGKNINLRLLNLTSRYIEHKSEIFHTIRWGTLIPLHFINKDNIPIGLMSIDRNIPIGELRKTGYEIFSFLDALEVNIGLVFSCDLSHAHSHHEKNFPFDPNSKIYDQHVYDVILNHAIEDYNSVESRVVSSANTDAHAQLTMLSSICEHIEYEAQVMSYEVPSYYGMLTALVNIK